MLLKDAAFVRLCRAREMLREPALQSLPIAHVAREIGMSPFHFLRRFEALFGMTPHRFRTRARLDRARVLLASGAHSVTEVCFELGYASLGSFSDRFTRDVGVAPAAFRRTARLLVPAPERFTQRLFPGCLGLMACLPAGAFGNFREARGDVAR